jgi:hypothetical protein
MRLEAGNYYASWKYFHWRCVGPYRAPDNVGIGIVCYSSGIYGYWFLTRCDTYRDNSRHVAVKAMFFTIENKNCRKH